VTYVSRNMKKVIGTVFALAFLSSAALADSIVLSGPVVVKGFGFGADPRDLTIQSHGPGNNSEQGCIAPGLIEGSSACAPVDGLVGGDEAPPLSFPKQGAPSLASLGITNGDQIGILFDADQPQDDTDATVTINDLTLKLYDGSTLVYTVSGTFSGLVTNPGNGSSDYLFTLDAAAVTDFNAALAGNFSDTIALDSKISFPKGSGGPESYAIVDVNNNAPIPEPSTLMLLGTGALGIAGVIKRKLA
jgi:hypothetical protein